jgi:hypothetical protein
MSIERLNKRIGSGCVKDGVAMYLIGDLSYKDDMSVEAKPNDDEQREAR